MPRESFIEEEMAHSTQEASAQVEGAAAEESDEDWDVASSCITSSGCLCDDTCQTMRSTG